MRLWEANVGKCSWKSSCMLPSVLFGSANALCQKLMWIYRIHTSSPPCMPDRSPGYFPWLLHQLSWLFLSGYAGCHIMVWLIEVVSFPPPPPDLLINILLYTLISTFLASGCLYLLELSEGTLVKLYTLYYDKYCRQKLLTRFVIMSCLQNSIKNPAWYHRWWNGEWAASCMHEINSGKSHHNRVTKLDH